MTAYRQEALRCAALLHQQGGGPMPVALLREQAEAPNATRILYRNVYGWFEPAGRGSTASPRRACAGWSCSPTTGSRPRPRCA